MRSSNEASWGEKIEYFFRTVLPRLLVIAAGLSNSKELRDVYEDIVEKVIMPLRSQGWAESDVRLVVDSTVSSFSSRNLGLGPEAHARFVPVYQRFFAVIRPVVLRLYTN